MTHLSLLTFEQLDSVRDSVAVSYHIPVLFALIIYEYMITFEKERLYIWQRKTTIPTVLFCIIRYIPLISVPCTMIIAMISPRINGLHTLCGNSIWDFLPMGVITSVSAGIMQSMSFIEFTALYTPVMVGAPPLVLQVYVIYAQAGDRFTKFSTLATWILIFLLPVSLVHAGIMINQVGFPYSFYFMYNDIQTPLTELLLFFLSKTGFELVILLLTQARGIYLTICRRGISQAQNLITKTGLCSIGVSTINLAVVLLLRSDKERLNILAKLCAPIALLSTPITIARLFLSLRETAGLRVVSMPPPPQSSITPLFQPLSRSSSLRSLMGLEEFTTSESLIPPGALVQNPRQLRWWLMNEPHIRASRI
ncbi:hypothetical protein M422DRAFT_48352 [Sphaerobolus stellatus SS14]|uniref:DUF6533 domain-containing protein n=1 Tax=Sphaerobolus stellatus (strain SS14) TaxID=990650 RepID=A0A0C9UGG1_SPHS4|nr:hypothetical protein M422DRAFT_48352 [Sphaerobolus stellatus SS14]